MSAKWLDPFEKMLIVALSGFAFWPNNISSMLVIALVAIRLIQKKWQAIPQLSDLWLLAPALLLLISWAAFGMATDGGREMQIWFIWLAAIVYFKTSPHANLLKQAFILLSIGQATVVLAFFAFIEPMALSGFAQHIRDSIELHFHVHPTFLSAAWSWAALLVWLEWRVSIWKKLSATFILIAMAALCGGKMPILAAFLVAFIIPFFQTDLSKKTRMYIMAGLMIAFVAVVFTPVIQERSAELLNLHTDFKEGDMLTSSQVRAGVWQCTWSSIKDHWIMGVGLGNTRFVLDACYALYEQNEFFEGEFNSHNQMAHFWLSGGVFSFLAFLGFYMLMLFRAWKRHDKTVLIFLCFFFLICLTENYFSRQFGMMLWAIFALGNSYQNDQTSVT